MREHVFLCGLSAEQAAEHPSGTMLSLHDHEGNLKLKLDRLRKRLAGNEPTRLTDFIEIASYVFAADRTTSRGPLWDPGFGARWRRNFVLVIAVRELSFWQRQDVTAALCDALGFVSEDCWRFEFVSNHRPKRLQDYLPLEQEGTDNSGESSIVLFSGGLDSLAGAVHELGHTDNNLVLVSHRNLPIVGARQMELAKKLATAHPGRIRHVWVDNSLTGKLSDRETTQRTRSFFFTAMAAVAAHIQKSARIRFYENGVMSINLPFAVQVVGARASRSTHPHSLRLLGRVVQLVSSQPIKIDNPFIWRTKAEIVGELAGTQHAGLIARSLSCSSSRVGNKSVDPHCGRCIQCLQRRISTLAGGAGGIDDGYETDFLLAPRKNGRDRVMAFGSVSLALDCASNSEQDFLGRFSEPLAWALQAYPTSEREDVAKQVIDLYRRHGVTVRTILIEAAQPQVPAVLDRALAPSSLLALVLASKLIASQIAQPAPPDRLPEPSPERTAASGTENDIFIAIDAQRQRIMISDRAELHGHAIYPIMRFLIEASMKDCGNGLLSKNHRCFRGKVIAAALVHLDEGAVRAAIKRARADFEEAERDLYGTEANPNAIIEHVDRKGYRLNPNVKAVTLAEYNNR